MLPINGRVVVVDDQITEALPLIKLLNLHEASTMYFSGDNQELPEEPYKGIRLLFLDLRFSSYTDSKTVAANALNLVSRIISENNGPYLLLIWSAHENDYAQDIESIFNKSKIKPEYILYLSKADYFETVDSGNEQFLDLLEAELKKQRIIGSKFEAIMNLAVAQFQNENAVKSIKKDSISLIESKLKSELAKANLFNFFILWENTIHSAKYKTVNQLYKEVPDIVPDNKKLSAMMYYLAYHTLEQQMEDASEIVKFNAALDTLNNLFPYFYIQDIQELDFNTIEDVKFENNKEFKDEISTARFNKWLLTTEPTEHYCPGNLYVDEGNQFKFHGLISGTPENQAKILEEIAGNNDICFVNLEISGDCEVAQNKNFVSKIVPGLLMPYDLCRRLLSEGKIKNSAPEYICTYGPLEYNGREWQLFLNLNLYTFKEKEYIKERKALFTLRHNYLANIRTRLGNIITKQGIGIFK